MEIDRADRALTMLTDRGYRTELFLDYDRKGDLSVAKLEDIAPVTGAVGRPIGDERNSDIEAIARMPNGGWVVAFERNHRLLITPPGLDRARSNRRIEAATETADKKIILITSRAFNLA